MSLQIPAKRRTMDGNQWDGLLGFLVECVLGVWVILPSILTVVE